MKKLIQSILISLGALSASAQSVIINPNNLQIPSLSSLPACAAADYGKIVFLTSTNRANVCGGSGWIEVTAGGGGGGGSLTLPYSASGSYSAAGFSVMNTGGGLNSAGIQGMTASALNGANGILGNAFETAPSGNNAGVRGNNSSTNGNGYGVFGSHDGGGSGVYGTSVTGFGVSGSVSGTGGTAVYGTSAQAVTVGVMGLVTNSSSTGVYGKATNANSTGGTFENSTSTGFALQTIGKLKFQGNNASTGRVLTSTDGTGTASWTTLTRTEILKLGPAAFQSHISTNESTMGSQGISMTTAAGSFHANVSVPNGATITAVKIYYIDNDGTSPSTGLGLTNWALQKMTNSGSGSYSNIFSISIPNISASTSIQNLISSPLSEVVNNATTLYRVVVAMPASLNLVLVGAEISYTYTVNN